MKHGDHLVDLIDGQGNIIGQKRRSDIDKMVDVYNGVFVLIVTPQGELVLSDIAERQDLPNIYARTFGTSCCVIRRSNESSSEAAVRGLKVELLLDNATCKLLGEGMVTLADGRKTLLSAYCVIDEPPTGYSTADIEGLRLVSIDQFEEELGSNPERFAPTLRAIWRLYRNKLAVG